MCPRVGQWTIGKVWCWLKVQRHATDTRTRTPNAATLSLQRPSISNTISLRTPCASKDSLVLNFRQTPSQQEPNSGYRCRTIVLISRSTLASASTTHDVLRSTPSESKIKTTWLLNGTKKRLCVCGEASCLLSRWITSEGFNEPTAYAHDIGGDLMRREREKGGKTTITVGGRLQAITCISR